MKNIVFHASGFGDLFVCFKALYATKCLYPDYKLILFIDGFQDKNFLKWFGDIFSVIYEYGEGPTLISAGPRRVYFATKTAASSSRQLGFMAASAARRL